MSADDEYIESVQDAMAKASQIPGLHTTRCDLARFASDQCLAAADELHVAGHLFGTDRRDGISPFGNGSDETVGVSVLLRIASQLLIAATDLFSEGRTYAACALLRQIVEVEYLAWAFETRHRDAERWLRSTRQEREKFFSPRKLREAADGQFRGQDYGSHCEMGGHPVPGARFLFREDPARDGLLMADLLGHIGRIWEHLDRWATSHEHGASVLRHTPGMRERFMAWKEMDPLVDLPPAP